MTTTPGGGSSDAVGRNPEFFAPEYAANSAIAGEVLTTPTPPTAPPLNSGTPPGLTASGSLSLVSALPVMMPRPGWLPLIERDGFNICPGMKWLLRVQPRLVFSIPYRSALGAPPTPGGKCMPLMNRTVREDKGAWSLLKKAAVRAKLTANSSAGTV